jgi:class 3 adenylate cyclase/tetratricopeptide (TPR) repeat protein
VPLSYALHVTTCSACGAENREGARFCDTCGAPLVAAEAPAREERKVVTVLFADLVGFTQRAETMDPEDVRALLQPYWQRLRSELERFGGTVEKFIGDAVMALFGAPVAHEDDPERAVRAALAIRDWVREEEDIQVRIAVNTGEALVLLGARPVEGEGMATGDVVNTAARLQSAAPTNGILVGEATWRATRDRIEYQDAEPVAAKGKSEPIGVWEPVQARARVGMDLEQQSLTPLVGREAELGALVDALERVKREREPQLVTLVGVPGIGKSRLVAELFQRVDAGADLVWWRQGRALPYGAGVSFWALSEMVKAQAGIHENDSESEAAQKLRESVTQVVDDGDRSWVLRHLEPLIGVGEDSGADRAEAFTAWRRYLEGLADEHPLVLVFEDLHWADDGLLDFVDHLADWATGVPLLVLGSARPELLDRRPGWGGGKLNAATIALSPLEDADAARVIGAVLNQTLLPAETQQALLERAGGNPLYAEQFARLFLERGSVDDLPLPENVQGIIAARLDALPTEEKRLLQDAAVLGKVFWSGGVATLTHFSDHDIDDVLHALQRKGFVRRERRSAVSGQTEYAFRHVLVREVAYGQVPRPARVDKHVAAAGWIDSLGRAEDHAELLAYHYSTALELAQASNLDTSELMERTRSALKQAGDRALGLNSHGVAVGFYTTALELWSTDAEDYALLLLVLGRAEFLAGNMSPERHDHAAKVALERGKPELAAEAEATAAEAAWYRGEGDEVDARVDRALGLVEPLQSSRSKAWILSQASRYEMLAGRHDDAIEHATAALEMATELDLPHVRVHALNNLGSSRVRRGDEEGIADLEASAALAEEINSPELARALNNLGSMAFSLGDVRRCHELESRSLRVGERFGLSALVMFQRGNVLGSLYRLGEWDELVAQADSLITESPPAGPEAAARMMRAWVRVGRGDIEGGLADATWALDVGRRSGEPQSVNPAVSTMAYALVAAEQHARALPLAEEMLERWDSGPQKVPFQGSAEVASTWMQLVGLERVKRALGHFKVATPWLKAALAVLEEEYTQALAIYMQTESLSDQAFTHLRAAESLVERGRPREADPHVRSALAFYRSVRATAYIARAEKLLAATA